MNSIQYGFHRLYLHYASDEVFETAAIGRISIQDKEATDEEVILAEEGLIDAAQIFIPCSGVARYYFQSCF
jgi:hypothetical protein